MESILQDVRYALRQLRKSPGFALIAVLTLSLGVGAATAIFSVVDAVIVRPLPFQHSERIYVPRTLSRQGYQQPFSWPSFKDFRAQNHSFAAFSGVSTHSVNLETPSGPVALRWVQGSDNFFDVFGIAPVLGRTYRHGEDEPGKNDVAVLGYDVWQTSFGGDPNVIGRTLELDGHPYVCIGVMPAGFRYPLSAHQAIYTPLHPDPAMVDRRGSHWLQTVALLKPGVSREQAIADTNLVLSGIGQAYPDTDAGRKGQLIRLADSVAGNTRGALWTLCAAVAAILLIGCVNVAGLLLARGVKREREVALRAAVGADRARLVRQGLTESLILAAFGAAGGVLLSWLLLAALRTFLIHAMQRGADVHLDLPVLAAAVAISATTSIAASLYPSLRLSGVAPSLALRSSGSTAGTSRGQHRLRSVFIVSQVALSMVLLVVAGVLLKEVAGYRNTDLGFDTAHVLTAEINLSPGRYLNRNVWADFYDPMLERVKHLPGVRAAGVINLVPVQDWGWNSEIHVTGQPPAPGNEVTLAEQRFVSPGYFDVVGSRLIQGRMLSPGLDHSTDKSAKMIVNDAFAKRFMPAGMNPAGQHIDDSDKADEKTQIVGEVTGVRQDLMQPAMPEMDQLYTQVPAEFSALMMHTSLMVRTAGDPKAVIPALREVFHEVDPTLPFRAPETMGEVVADQLVMQRMESWLFGIFAGLALLLAVVGLYGLISHEVEMGTRNIGIRMALGSTRSGVFALILRRVAVLLAVGIVCGMGLTMAAQKLIASVAVIHFAQQAGLLALLVLTLGAAGLLAAVLPMQRAASVEPMEALRTE
ncbi:ABC transporter permease [Silvibacterium acidisoli]|uniref:ABC transporter permease n=1 Tax=Acidobacteriaceae bacterium ZG23-2 TaxID=2883246 RepID=UPI00406C2C32